MGITPKDPADFDPTMGNYNNLRPFRFWCQKVLPLVYDDSLSYYEVLCKLVDYLNKTMEDVGVLHDDVDALHTAYQQLQAYVNDYFSTLDVQQEINNKLDIMAADGTLDALILPYFNAYKAEINGIIADQNENISTFENNVNTSISGQNNRLTTLEGRMDTFSHLTEGSTTGDAELADIRVGGNGVTYNTAGDAVRGQFADVNNSIKTILSDEISYTNGYIVWGGGEHSGRPSPNANYKYSEFLTVKEYMTYYFSRNGFFVNFYESNSFESNWLGVATTSALTSGVTPPANAKYMVLSIEIPLNPSYSFSKGLIDIDMNLNDISVGFDGTKYTSPGNSVRGQIETVYTNIANNLLYDNISYTEGYIVWGGGEHSGRPSPNANYKYSEFLPVSEDLTYFFNRNGFFVNFYESNSFESNWLGIASTSALISGVTPPANAKYMVLSIDIALTPIVSLTKDLVKFKTEFDSFKNTNNIDDILLGDDVTYTEGYIVWGGAPSGRPSPNENYKYSEFLPVNESSTYYFSENGFFVNYYTGNSFESNWLGIATPSALTDGVTPPANARYMVMSMNIDHNVFYGSNQGIVAMKNEVEQGLESHTIYVAQDGSGDYTKLKDAIYKARSYNDAVIYVGSGTYDLITEFGDDYFTNYVHTSGEPGMLLMNNMHVIFSSNSKVTCHYTGDNTEVLTYWSPFNASLGGFTLENMRFEGSRTRYAIHDELSSQVGQYKNQYINCDIDFDNTDNPTDNTPQAIGGGCGQNGEIIIENCIFDAPAATANDGIVSYHNSGYGGRSNIIIKDSYFKGSTAGIRFGYYGSQTDITNCIVTNCSLPVAPILRPETQQSVVVNMVLLDWNNDIRS